MWQRASAASVSGPPGGGGGGGSSSGGGLLSPLSVGSTRSANDDELNDLDDDEIAEASAASAAPTLISASSLSALHTQRGGGGGMLSPAAASAGISGGGLQTPKRKDLAAIKDRLSNANMKSRTLPSRRNSKKNFTVASRLKTFMHQQRIDGVYCVVALVPPPPPPPPPPMQHSSSEEAPPALPPQMPPSPKSPSLNAAARRKASSAAATGDDSDDSSSDSSDDSSDSDSSDSSSDSDDDSASASEPKASAARGGGGGGDGSSSASSPVTHTRSALPSNVGGDSSASARPGATARRPSVQKKLSLSSATSGPAAAAAAAAAGKKAGASKTGSKANNKKKKSKKSSKSYMPPRLKLPEPVIFVLNRHGGIFGKNLSLGAGSAGSGGSGGAQGQDQVGALPPSSSMLSASMGRAGEDSDSIDHRPTPHGGIPLGTAGGTGGGGSSSKPPPPPKPCTIQDPYTSKRHFQILGDNKGRFHLTDLGSLNGTFVRRNFEPILYAASNAGPLASNKTPFPSMAAASSSSAASNNVPLHPGLSSVGGPVFSSFAPSTSSAGAIHSSNAHHPHHAHHLTLAHRGMSPVTTGSCSSPTQSSRNAPMAIGASLSTLAPAAATSGALSPTSAALSSGKEGWGTGSWANNHPAQSPLAGGAAAVPAALSPSAAASAGGVGASGPGSETTLQALLREASSGSGDNSSSQSGYASVSGGLSGYASVGTQWLNAHTHAVSSGYRLVKNAVFLLGKCELTVQRMVDMDNPAPTPAAEGDAAAAAGASTALPALPTDDATEGVAGADGYHVLLSYSYRAAAAAPPSSDSATGSATTSPAAAASASSAAAAAVVSPLATGSHPTPSLTTRSRLIGVLGARIGRHPDNDIVLPVGADAGVDEWQAEVLCENGKFFLRDLHPSMEKGLWYRVAPVTESTASHQSGATASAAATSCPLYNGDRVKVGTSEFLVQIRSIPPPLSLTSQGSLYEIGTALEGNFSVQKEMQDRLVAVGNYGGHAAQAFLGIYDGHQERTVADFAAAALHHNLLEEIAEVHRRGAAEFEFLHHFRSAAQLKHGGGPGASGSAMLGKGAPSASSSSSSVAALHKSLSGSMIHSPLHSGLAYSGLATGVATPIPGPSSGATGMPPYGRSRSGSEARPLHMGSSIGLHLRGSSNSGAGAGSVLTMPSPFSPGGQSSNGSVCVSPAHPALNPANRNSGPFRRGSIGLGAASSGVDSESEISLDALSRDPPLPRLPTSPACISPWPNPAQTLAGSVLGGGAGLSVNCSEGPLPPSVVSPSAHVTLMSQAQGQAPLPLATGPTSSRGLTPLSHAAAHHRNPSASASSYLAQQLQSHIGRLVEVDMLQCIKSAYARTSLQIKGMGDAASYGGSTAAVVVLWYHPLLQEVRLYSSNVGDSRALLVREGGRPELLSHLHIGRDPSEQARVKAAGGRIMQNGRLAGCLEVTRAFGDHGMISFGLVSEPFLMETTIQPTDTHLLVSSDGLFDVLSYDEIARMLVAAPEQLSAQHLAFALVEAAMKRKARDNMSVIVVKLKKYEPGAASAAANATAEMINTRSHSSATPGVGVGAGQDVSAGSSGSLLSSFSGSSAKLEDMVAATAGLVEQLARPLARVPSLLNLFAPPSSLGLGPASSGGSGGSSVSVSHKPSPSPESSPMSSPHALPTQAHPSSGLAQSLAQAAQAAQAQQQNNLLPPVGSPLPLLRGSSTGTHATSSLGPASDFSVLESNDMASSVPPDFAASSHLLTRGLSLSSTASNGSPHTVSGWGASSPASLSAAAATGADAATGHPSFISPEPLPGVAGSTTPSFLQFNMLGSAASSNLLGSPAPSSAMHGSGVDGVAASAPATLSHPRLHPGIRDSPLDSSRADLNDESGFNETAGEAESSPLSSGVHLHFQSPSSSLSAGAANAAAGSPSSVLMFPFSPGPAAAPSPTQLHPPLSSSSLMQASFTNSPTQMLPTSLAAGPLHSVEEHARPSTTASNATHNQSSSADTIANPSFEE